MNASYDVLTNVRSIPEHQIVTAKKETLSGRAQGEVKVVLYDANGGRRKKATMRIVLYVPGLETNLLSCKVLVEARANVTFRKEHCTLKDADTGSFQVLLAAYTIHPFLF